MPSMTDLGAKVAKELKSQEIRYHNIAVGACDFAQADDVTAFLAELDASSYTWKHCRDSDFFATKETASASANLRHVVDYSQVIVGSGVSRDELFSTLMLFADLNMIHQFMIAVNWRWTHRTTGVSYTPSTAELKLTCSKMVDSVLSGNCTRAATGGFEVCKTVDLDGTVRLHLMFKMSSAEFSLATKELSHY